MADEKAIIIVKKKGGHGGHHGGAWKVAYADFVTAMMAFFMVMWLVNSAETSQREAIASYFRKPGLFQSGSGVPLLIGGAGILSDAYAPNLASPERKFVSGMHQIPMTKRSGEEDGIKKSQAKPKGEAGKGVIENGQKDSSGFGLKETSQKGRGKGSDPKAIQKLKEGMAAEIKKQLAGIPELAKLLGTVDVKIEADGINIEIMDSPTQSMFEVASSTINPMAKAAFFKVADVLKESPNKIDIVGHTDGRPFGRGFKGYTNWELSADRANSARRLLEEAGVSGDRFTSVLGRADRELKDPENPLAEQNRRITLKVKFPEDLQAKAAEEAEKQLDPFNQPQEEEEEEIPTFTPAEIIKKGKERVESPVKLEPQSKSSEGALPKNSIVKEAFGDFPVIRETLPIEQTGD